MSELSFDAMSFARYCHRHQLRKYTAEPYFLHLAEVAGIVAAVAPDHLAGEMVATAYLHDCIEDQGVSHETLSNRFGSVVANAVLALSDLEIGNRAQRKEAGRKRLSAAAGWVQTVKVADLISNTSSIVRHDPKFAPVYLEEKRLLLGVLTRADPRLLKIATEVAETVDLGGLNGFL